MPIRKVTRQKLARKVLDQVLKQARWSYYQA